MSPFYGGRTYVWSSINIPVYFNVVLYNDPIIVINGPTSSPTYVKMNRNI